MILCFIMLGLFAALFVLAAKTEIPKNHTCNWIMTPFYKASIFLMNIIKKRPGLKSNRSVERDLEALCFGKKEKIEHYYIEKLALVLGVIFLGTGVSLGAESLKALEPSLLKGNQLVRPGYGEGNREDELALQIEGQEESEVITVEVGEQQYSKEEKKTFLKNAMDSMEECILGENSSLDEVRKRMNLPKTVLDGLVNVEWVQEPYGVLDEDGYIAEDIEEEGTLVKLTASLDCKGERGEYSTYAKILPPLYTREEELQRRIQSQIKDANEENANENVLYLPELVDGKKVIWSEAPSEIAGLICVISIIAGACIYIGRDREITKRALYRKQQLTMDYPDMLFKLSMLLGAGLTLQSAFFKIALEYEENKGAHKRYVYEEMLISYYAMKSGLSEGTAYEEFGNRCQDSKYVKLGAMLAQNLRKGSGGLMEMLQNEAVMSMEERSQIAKRLGEEAGTKLLMPMVMMLAVVLVILMVPAMMSF